LVSKSYVFCIAKPTHTHTHTQLLAYLLTYLQNRVVVSVSESDISSTFYLFTHNSQHNIVAYLLDYLLN